MTNRKFLLAMLAISTALVLAGCSKTDPKALAKQTYDLTVEVMTNPLKAVTGMVKAANIGKKVSKLSPADKQIYTEELARLTGQKVGDLNRILSGILGGDGALSGETLNALMEAIGKLSSSGGATTAPAGQ